MTQGFRENLIKKLGRDNFERVREAKIGIAGAGGLGSNCAVNLVRVGFRRLKIVDFDKVEAANLDRQFYFSDQIGMLKVKALKSNLLRISSDLEIEIKAAMIDRTNAGELFADYPIIAECLDRADHKSMLVSALMLENKFIVAVSGLGGIGSADDIRTRRITDRLVVIGDLKSDIAEEPAFSPRVNVAAAKQADMILKHVVIDRN